MVTPGLFGSSRKENTIRSVRQKDESTVIRCKGGQYGSQPFTITVPLANGESAVFNVQPIVANWWEIMEAKLELSVDSQTHQYTTHYQFTMYEDDSSGGETKEIISENLIKMSGI